MTSDLFCEVCDIHYMRFDNVSQRLIYTFHAVKLVVYLPSKLFSFSLLRTNYLLLSGSQAVVGLFTSQEMIVCTRKRQAVPASKQHMDDKNSFLQD